MSGKSIKDEIVWAASDDVLQHVSFFRQTIRHFLYKLNIFRPVCFLDSVFVV